MKGCDQRKPSSSIPLSVTSNSSKYWQRCPINVKASFETELQHSILREVSEVQEFVMSSMETYVISRQHVMSNFLNSLCDRTRKESWSSVNPEHALKLNSLSGAHQFPMVVIPEQVKEQPSNLTDCNAGKFCRHFERSAVNCNIIKDA